MSFWPHAVMYVGPRSGRSMLISSTNEIGIVPPPDPVGGHRDRHRRHAAAINGDARRARCAAGVPWRRRYLCELRRLVSTL